MAKRKRKKVRKSAKRRARYGAMSVDEKFFYRMNGLVDPKLRRKAAKSLAHAEKEMAERGWKVKWTDSDLPYEMGDAETEMPSEVLDAVLYDASGRVIGSLGSIGDPSRDYARLVEAELASEALHDIGVSVEPLP